MVVVTTTDNKENSTEFQIPYQPVYNVKYVFSKGHHYEFTMSHCTAPITVTGSTNISYKKYFVLGEKTQD